LTGLCRRTQLRRHLVMHRLCRS